MQCYVEEPQTYFLYPFSGAVCNLLSLTPGCSIPAACREGEIGHKGAVRAQCPQTWKSLSAEKELLCLSFTAC